MRLLFLPSTRRDLAWFRYYYRSVFPAGDANARAHFQAITQLLTVNPYMGRPAAGHTNVRELPITRTPFVLIYRVAERQIEVLRLWDTRQGSSP